MFFVVFSHHQCPQGSFIHWYTCCGVDNTDCCFGIQTWFYVVSGFLMLVSWFILDGVLTLLELKISIFIDFRRKSVVFRQYCGEKVDFRVGYPHLNPTNAVKNKKNIFSRHLSSFRSLTGQLTTFLHFLGNIFHIYILLITTTQLYISEKRKENDWKRVRIWISYWLTSLSSRI